ncbi:MAG: hypothetical protein NTY14_04400, partial [Candidatus Omnitrophica bacterium]|nr:hypothetical protein [Candidatus Omnitrophota bacterium]
MKENTMFLLVLWFLLTASVTGLLYLFFKSLHAQNKKRRRWARIRVPNEKVITCKIGEPLEFSGDKEYLVDDINVAGIAFFSDKPIDKTALKLFVRFPFTTFNEASTVWGKVVYCNTFAGSGKYRVGICYVRHKKG